MHDKEVPVLIVGGSLVGMSSALLLGHHGIRALAVEHHRGTAIHPRAAQISQRTMEVFRTVGVEQIVRHESDKQFVQDGAINAVESLAGKELAAYIPNLNEGVRDVSPTIRLFITQSLLEPLLKQRALELGAELRFGTEMISCEQDADGVTATIRDRDSGRTEAVRARYLVAADGARSALRDRLGIRMLGHGTFSNSITIYFRGDVGPLLRGRNLSVVYITNPTLRGFFRLEKPFDRGFLVVNAVGDPERPITDVSGGLTDEKCVEYIRRAIGTDQVPITIDNVMHWNARADVAERFRAGRIFLVGDAAHVMPPNGGFGGNTGVQDAHNLAWKLALVLKGQAGPELLSTYEAERRPAAALTVEQAYSRYVTRSAPYLGTEGMQAVENDLNVELGYCYYSEAIIPDDEDRRAHQNPRESKGRPGTRAPHLWLRRGSEQVSTIDLFGGNFTILAGPEGSAWCAAAREAAGRVRINVDAHQIGAQGAFGDPEHAFPAAYGITPGGAVLVRPDGFVAWRAKTADDAAARTLSGVLMSILCRKA
jgi:2-polyprenyl-6-methoxyphenol hydroxylase-like FAD-dependent oxidoreductase